MCGSPGVVTVEGRDTPPVGCGMTLFLHESDVSVVWDGVHGSAALTGGGARPFGPAWAGRGHASV